MVSSSTGYEGITLLPEETEVVKNLPPLIARWIYAILLIALFFGLQIGVAVPFIFAEMSANPYMTQDEYMAFMTSEEGLLISIGAAAVGGIGTILFAVLWPIVWNLLFSAMQYSAADWLGWRSPRLLKWWLVAPLTLVVLVGVGYVINAIFGESSVDAQVMLFTSGLPLQIAAALTVSLVAPVSEEIVFRGALYNAMLTKRDDNPIPWVNHILPFIVATIGFGAIHLVAGFEKPGSIIMIFLLSAFLTWLRAFTGSVRSPMVAHMAWNTMGAIAMILYANGIIE